MNSIRNCGSGIKTWMVFRRDVTRCAYLLACILSLLSTYTRAQSVPDIDYYVAEDSLQIILGLFDAFGTKPDAANHLKFYIGAAGPDTSYTPFTEIKAYGPLGRVPDQIHATSIQYKNITNTLANQIKTYIQRNVCFKNLEPGFTLKSAGIKVPLLDLSSEGTHVNLRLAFGGTQVPTSPSPISPDGSTDWPNGLVSNLHITTVVPGNVYSYVGTLELNWMDRYSFDPEDATNPGGLAARYLQPARWVRPFFTTIKMQEAISGTVVCNEKLPPVLWELTTDCRHTGYNGLSDPLHLWGTTGSFVQTPVLTNNAIDPTKESFQSDQSFVSPDGTKGYYHTTGVPGRFEWSTGNSTSWSGTFIMQEIGSSLNWSAWVRGGPGTAIKYDIAYDGSWSGTLRYSGSARLQGGGQTSVAATPSLTIFSSGTATTGTETRLYKNLYPYSRAQFKFPALPNPNSSDTASLNAAIETSCILFCDPPSQTIGSGNFKIKVGISLAQGQPPVPILSSSGSSLIQAKEGDIMQFKSMSYDPDNSSTPGDGIENFIWRVNGEVAQSGPSGGFIWRVPAAGDFIVSIEVFDDEGMSSIQTEQVHATALEPDTNPQLVIARGFETNTISVFSLGARGWRFQQSEDLKNWVNISALQTNSGLTGLTLARSGIKRFYRLARQ